MKGGVVLKINKLDSPIFLLDDDPVRVKEMGNITEIMFSEKRSSGGYITKIDKDHYVDNRTGELFNFRHIENRSQDLANVAKSLAQGRDILNTNITDVSCCRWLTLTYADNMTDPKKLQKDFENFNVRCRSVFGHYEYITAAEPQARGAWHLHVVLIFKSTAPYMSNEIVSNCWKQGFVTVKRLDDVDNVGAYLTAYLGDMEFSEVIENNCFSVDDIQSIKEVEITDETGFKSKKKYVKGARLYMYPSGFHIFRYSKGIKRPVISRCSYKKAKEKASFGKLTFSKTVVLEDSESDFKNILQYEYYNSKRK